jgi:repressor LexA
MCTPIGRIFMPGTEVPEPRSEESAMADFSQLTDKQKLIYDCIREKIESRGYGPTVREIGDVFGIKSPNGVMCHLKALEKKGLIKREGRSARAIQLVDHRRPSHGLPFLGHVAAGAPLAAVAQEERFSFDDMFTGPDRYVLHVRGNSMIDNHIEDGDYVVIKKQETAENGTRVVAMVDNEVTLKKFYRERDHVRLEPANGSMAPILVDSSRDVKILGVLTAVLRKC